MLSSCLIGHHPTRWKSLMVSVVTWLGLWARILPRQRSCTSLESPRLKVSCMNNQCTKWFPRRHIGVNTLCWISFWFFCGKNRHFHDFPQTCRPRCLTLTSFCPYTNTSARPRTAERLRTLWRASGYLTRRGTAQSWGLSSGTFWQHWVSRTVLLQADFIKLSL